MSDKLNIEQLFRAKLDGTELTPSPASWKAIQRQLRWKQFLRFNPTRFNVYYAGALLLAATGLVVILAGEKSETDQTIPEELTLPISPEERGAEAGTGESGPDSNSELRGDEIQETTDSFRNAIDSGTESDHQISEAGPDENVDSSRKSLDEMLRLSPEIDNQQAPAPIAYFTSSIQSGCAPLTVQFTDQSLNATSYLWDFGTGDISREQHPVYEFKEAGRYMVTLTTENHGSQPTASRMMVEVLASPVADFQIEEGLEGLDNHVVLNLVNYSSGGAAFTWNLVNENCIDCRDWSSNEYQPGIELKFISPESRSVRLEVINELGCMDT
ncbi:MAG: PKD domain-containing protein, partial [Bacteroidota bacterium]|nr:PKD domain-containing protein [Bacteroidota bacterium]